MAPVAPAGAQDLLQTYRLARDADPQFRAAQFTARANETALPQARAGLLPTVRFEVDQSESRQRIHSSENSIFGAGVSTYPGLSQTLSITQPIYRREAIERYRQAKLTVQQAGLSVLAAEQDLMLRTAAAYLSVLAARDALALARAEREAVGRAMEQARERLRAGVGTITNQYDASARHAVTQAREIESRNKLEDALQALTEITGQRIEVKRALRDDLPVARPDPPELAPWLAAAASQNLALQSRRLAAEVAQLEVARQRAGHHPSLSLVYQHNRNDTGSTLFGGGSDVSNSQLSLRLSVPIFEGGLTSAVTREAARKHDAAREQVEQERRALDRLTRAAFAGLNSGAELIDALGQSVQAQAGALDAKDQGYRAGLNTILPVLDAQRDLYAARRDHAQARYEQMLNRLKLAQATGVLSEADLGRLDAALR